ncbi:MAG: DUF1294 domain-containing protein [Anaerolineaceae bacterium]
MLIGYYLIVNLVTFLVWGFDKFRAQTQQWRVPERVLFTLMVIGGAFGAVIGMQVFHHKTRKNVFWVVGILGCIIHAAIIVKFTLNQ